MIKFELTCTFFPAINQPIQFGGTFVNNAQ